MSKIRTPPNLAGLDVFASKAAMISIPTDPSSAIQDLNQRNNDQEENPEKHTPEKESIITTEIESRKSLATSLYFFDEDRKRLDTLIGEIKKITPYRKKISVSLVLRGLLLMAEKSDPAEVVAAIKEISF